MAEAVTESAGAKRKRGVTERTSPDTRRSKRGGGAAANDAAALLQSAVSAVDAAQQAAQAQQQNADMNPADFAALQKATTGADHGGPDDHGAAAGGHHGGDPGSVGPQSPDAAAASSTAQAAQAALGSMYPSIHVGPGPAVDDSFGAPHGASQDQEPQGPSPYEVPSQDVDTTAAAGMPGMPQTNGLAAAYKPKPVVGSQEWHKLRKDNHKEVERRRRETINEGINELAKLVPNCDKNKGSILQRAVQYITQLKEEESGNLEKWTLEKLLTEQAIGELSSTNDRLKQDLDRAYRELDAWKKAAQSAGVEPPKEDVASVS